MRKFLVAAPKLFAAAYGERRRLTVNSSRRRASSIGEKLVFNTLVAAREQRFARRRGRALTLSSVLLRNTSSLRRRLHFEKRARRGLTRRKTAALLRKRGRANLWQIQKVALHNQGAQYIGRTLADSLPEHSGMSPLYFQNPTTKIIKSAGAKAKELEADIASKEARYKLTAQYVESLTRLVPELINFMFSKQISQEHRKITLDVARHLVRNIY